MEEITLRGERYLGIFRANIEKAQQWCGSEYSERLEYIHFWKGEGKIIDSEIGESQSFTFQTPPKKDWDSLINLERNLVRIEKDFRGTNPRLVRPNVIYDKVLREMYEKAEANTEIIPHISPPTLEYDMLLDRGLIAEEKTGQIMLGYQEA